MQKIIVTSGKKFTDIDALACSVAYKKLLDLLSMPARLVLPGPLNESVSKTVKTWDLTYESSMNDDPSEYLYVPVDISDPEYFPDFVVTDNILEMYDHRWGFEKMWEQKLGTGARIVVVGACATLIWEEYKKRSLQEKIDGVSASLLYTAIISNTLNFNAQITTPRDREASRELLEYTTLPSDWTELYFKEIEESLIKDPLNALKNDTKEITINNTGFVIGQLEMWDSTNFIEKHKVLLLKALRNRAGNPSFITLPSISQGINYIFCVDRNTQDVLSKAIGTVFDGDLGITNKLWLRKEIIRMLESLK